MRLHVVNNIYKTPLVIRLFQNRNPTAANMRIMSRFV